LSMTKVGNGRTASVHPGATGGTPGREAGSPSSREHQKGGLAAVRGWRRTASDRHLALCFSGPVLGKHHSVLYPLACLPRRDTLKGRSVDRLLSLRTSSAPAKIE